MKKKYFFAGDRPQETTVTILFRELAREGVILERTDDLKQASFAVLGFEDRHGLTEIIHDATLIGMPVVILGDDRPHRDLAQSTGAFYFQFNRSKDFDIDGFVELIRHILCGDLEAIAV